MLRSRLHGTGVSIRVLMAVRAVQQAQKRVNDRT